MDNLQEIMASLKLDNHLSLKDIPDIDLYMDQVIQLFEKQFSDSKRNEEEKILTKTMINNYAKGKLFIPVKNKKYSREHLILISLIYHMKGALSIGDIKQLLERLNDKIAHEDFQADALYESFLALSEQNENRVLSNITDITDEVTNEVEKLADTDKDYLETLLLAVTFANISSFYRRAAEKLVDGMVAQNEKDD
ncbi:MULTISPECIES: DUF1836 domain-containing protein [unclassified Virgibacillus]|uniref:DUF1836 domain-containing protein n=1 Tax=unclassified Virgibacillus TaxID=2620237 RepID=UPI0024DEB78A|nr:DUF1836 domain-containing protein [Virgibacillus sp. LDC-1]